MSGITYSHGVPSDADSHVSPRRRKTNHDVGSSNDNETRFGLQLDSISIRVRRVFFFSFFSFSVAFSATEIID